MSLGMANRINLLTRLLTCYETETDTVRRMRLGLLVLEIQARISRVAL